jgi:hypothetical protein
MGAKGGLVLDLTRGNINDQLEQTASDRAGASFLTGLAWPIRGMATPPISDVAGKVWSGPAPAAKLSNPVVSPGFPIRRKRVSRVARRPF